MPNPTLYDNFNQVRQYIDQNQVDLSSYISKSELEGMSYVTTTALENASYATNADLSTYLVTPNIYGSSPGPYKLYSAGLSANTQYKHIYPNNYSYANFASLDSNAWMSKNTVKNYVEGRIADIESTYATQTYVADYVAEHGGGGSAVIDENIIPKENNTYTLGDSTYIYTATYTDAVYVNTNNKIYNTAGGGMKVQRSGTDICAFLGGGNLGISPVSNNTGSLGNISQIWNNIYSRNHYLGTGVRMYSESSASSNDLAIDFGGVSYYFMNNNRFAPNGSSNHDKLALGTSDRRWGESHIKNLYAENAYISNYNNFIWTGTAEEYASLSDYTTYQLYLVKDE